MAANQRVVPEHSFNDIGGTMVTNNIIQTNMRLDIESKIKSNS